MDKTFEGRYHQLEQDHFWFRCRRELIFRIIKNYPGDSMILDVGCSTGILLEQFRDKGHQASKLYGIDKSKVAIEACKRRGLSNSYQLDAEDFNLNETFDIIIASDCLEHLKDEKLAITTWRRHLKKNGLLIVFVPAFNSLWSYHDEVNQHYRRYRKKELIDLIKTKGLNIKKSGYWNSLLFLPIWGIRQVQKLTRRHRQAEEGDLETLPFANDLFYSILKQEEKLFDRYSLPFGVSAYCLATKD
jgi:SAM-dependent methyltransferase